jgi:GTP-binding protein LepA
VFAGFFPTDADDFPSLREALDRLQLNDAALQFEPESPERWAGFRCGFLACPHGNRAGAAEREYGVELISTAPTVFTKFS